MFPTPNERRMSPTINEPYEKGIAENVREALG